MIMIKAPVLTTTTNSRRVSAVIHVDGQVHCLWFQVQREYGQFLCHERSDAFVVGLLHFAMRHGHDIYFETPITAELHFQLTRFLLDVLIKYNDNDGSNAVKPIKLLGKCEDSPLIAYDAKHAVGAGLSCGVDSLHVLTQFLRSDQSWLNVTHGCVFKLHGDNQGDTHDKLTVIFDDLCERGRALSGEAGLVFVAGETNFDRGCIPGLRYDGSSTYANLFCILCLQKLFRVYHFASGYDMSSFYFNKGISQDPAHYDLLITASVTTRSIKLYLDGIARNRFEKVRELVDFELSHKYLDVCHRHADEHHNCSYRCSKCMRTMLELDLLNALDKYASVFDVPYFRAHYHQYLAEYYRGLLHRDPFCLEMRSNMRFRRVPLWCKLRALRIVVKKLLSKAIRFGKRGTEFEPH